MDKAEESQEERPDAKRFNRIRVFYRLYRKRMLAAFVVIAHIVGGLTSVQAVMQSRTSQGAVAWAISLNLFPYAVVPVYWVFGHTDFDQYNELKQDNWRKFEPIRTEIGESIAREGLREEPKGGIGKMLESLANYSFVNKNKVELLVNGRATYDSMYAAIDEAEDYILFQTYILRADETGKIFAEKLIAKAKEGVEICVLYDDIGSLGLDNEYVKSMKDAGIKVQAFTTNQRDGKKFQLNYRNHRKIVVVDGKVGFTGGLNIGDEYLDEHEKLTPWRDTHMRVEGPAAIMLQLPFAEDWQWVTGEVPKNLKWQLEPLAYGGEAAVLSLPSGPADEMDTCALFFLAAINSAEERLWIATAYFVPDEQIISALKLAHLRGVDVRIIVPKLIDSKLVEYSAQSYLDEIGEAGIRCFEYDEGFMHQKVMLIDEKMACVGSANMDNRSFRLNFECILAVKDAKFISALEQMLENDLSNSTEIKGSALDGKPFIYRLATRISRLLAPIQ